MANLCSLIIWFYLLRLSSFIYILFFYIETLKQEIIEEQNNNIQERQDHERIQEHITRELKLRHLILENFVPPEERKKLEDRAYFDEETDCWRFKPAAGSSGDDASDAKKSKPQASR